MGESMYPLVTVVVPVYNDARPLRICLGALAKQSYPPSRYEVVIVDNDSDDRSEVIAVASAFDFAFVAVERKTGAYAARNKGISVSRGEVIAFTDADCVPDSRWLERGVGCLLDMPDCGQVVGKVSIFFADPARPTAVELFEGLTAFPQERLLRQFHGGATANVFTWRRVIDHVGDFDARIWSNGDLEWGRRVHVAGYRQVYAPDVEVGHPARRSLAELRQRTRRLSGGVFSVSVKPDDSFVQRQKMFARLLLDDLTPPLKFAVDTFRSSKLERWTQKFIVVSVIVYVRGVSALEKIRLNLGGVPQRK